jgi:PHD/YefM family antitoxin component YafN of YafNO toxin-antitoxin module
MTVPYTLTLREAESRLRELVAQAQATREPIVVTTEETAEPVAAVMGIQALEKWHRQQIQLFQLQHRYLMAWLDRVEREWDDIAIRREFVSTWQGNIQSLWEVCPESSRMPCTTLILSVQRLDPDHLTRAQLDALRHSLTSLSDPMISEATIKKANQRLIESGLSPMMTFDDEMVQLYIDEL